MSDTTKPLVTFSDAAWAHIQKLIKQHPEQGALFHLTVYETGCTGYMYAPALIQTPHDGDIAVSLESGSVIYVSPEAIPAIQGTHIDYISTSLGQSELNYQNPNAEDLCGCGESFNLKPGIEAPGIKRYRGQSGD